MTQVMDSSLDEKTPWVYRFEDASGLSLTAFRKQQHRLHHRCFFVLTYCKSSNVCYTLYIRSCLSTTPTVVFLYVLTYTHFVVHQRFFLCSTIPDPVTHTSTATFFRPRQIYFIKLETCSIELKLFI